jgi:hypothetical protein
MNAHIAYMLHFLRSTYAQKAKDITFPMKLVSYPYSSGINENHQNNVLIVVTDITDISNARCYCAFAG